tara:strand:+ start:15875 stop:17146 length:1272 start_codon:yes stop_codon:yes gene_type:complete
MSSTLTLLKWNPLRKIGFRFAFIYLLLYSFPFPLSTIPGISWLSNFYYNSQAFLVQWMGDIFLGIEEISTIPTGSGDTTYGYVSLFCFLCLAAVGTLIWSILDRKRNNYERLSVGLIVWLRYYLAFFMLIYGFAKVFVLQFSDLSLFDLVKTYGESSPMGLVWNFMEFSDSYTIYTGMGEVLGGLLLLYRRTVTLGCIVSIAVMATVAALNYSYDVPVKLFSTHLLLIAFYILTPQYKRVFNFLIFNKPVDIERHLHYFQNRKWRLAGYIVKALFITYFLYSQISSGYQGQKLYGKKSPKPALYGIYEVDHFAVNKDTLTPLTTDQFRWRKLIIDKRRSGIRTMQDSSVYYTVKVSNDTLKLSSRSDTTNVFHMTYTELNDQLILKGTHKQDSISINLTKIDHTKMLLVNRGYHWINERPFNR